MVITKYECVGHVQKRVGKHLCDAKRKIAALNKVARRKLKELQEKEKEKKKSRKDRQRRRQKGEGKAKERERETERLWKKR